MSEQYPNNIEVRRWAQQLPKGHLVPDRGRIPQFVIAAWNRTHRDRPYVAAHAFHGTPNGYTRHSCRCERCTVAMTAAIGENARQRAAEDAELLADELLGESS